MHLAPPHITIDDTGDTRAELLAVLTNAMRALTDTPIGPVIRALLSQIAVNTELGDPLRASVMQGRRDQVRDVIARGVARGDLQPNVSAVRLSVDLEHAQPLLRRDPLEEDAYRKLMQLRGLDASTARVRRHWRG